MRLVSGAGGLFNVRDILFIYLFFFEIASLRLSKFGETVEIYRGYS